MMVNQPVGKPKTTLGGKILAQLIAFIGCVVFPEFVTAIAPVSWVKFERTGDRVTARAQICAFFLVPYKTLAVSPVIAISDRIHAGSETRERRSGQRDRVTKSEDEGFLVIKGADQIAEVSVTRSISSPVVPSLSYAVHLTHGVEPSWSKVVTA